MMMRIVVPGQVRGVFRAAALGLLVLSVSFAAYAQRTMAERVLQNEKVSFRVILTGNDYLSESMISILGPGWGEPVTHRGFFESDGDFGLDVLYADWRAPGKQNNADNPVVLSKKDFSLVGSEARDLEGGAKEIVVFLKGKECPFDVRVTYRLDRGAFYVRKNLTVMDTTTGLHFLRWFWPERALVTGVSSVVKEGDFGQPVAILAGEGGAFFGLEYPASENRLRPEGTRQYRISCGQEYGERIGKTPLRSEWVVEAVTPDPFVKKWFFTYLDAIRVAPLRPYTLYNSWYDLRSPEYPQVPPENVMSESSAMKMVDILRKNMIEKHGIALDAFVLDDGWDVYKSDWVLRKEQFPHGLKPLADELKKTHTTLGLWFGPIGGYSFRDLRIGWMKEHGYEVVGDQLCVAGKNYGPLLRTRVADFAGNEGVGYFKWDGIQFACNQPDHGHPVDIYSRRAVMESVIAMCTAVRAKNPEMFLNITSGTWLSPWWVKYANTIWMDGEDYGYADVPSISKRDAAITYRDFVLYEDFSLKGLWFPVANLMTHGIIKGKLEMLGSPEEPLDKFTDDVLLYFARGVSMYELYISPDILSDGEWNTLAASITWARDRFPVLSTGSMIGGNPMKRETYGYAHFRGSRGIIAARNPFITPGTLSADFSPAVGLDPKATSLVLERVYPTRWVSPQLYAAGDRVDLPLDGYETAVYEVYPLADAPGPLLAGVVFDAAATDGRSLGISFHTAGKGARLLNPETVAGISVNGKAVDPSTFVPPPAASPALAEEVSVTGAANSVGVSFNLRSGSSDATLAVLLTPDGLTKLNEEPKLSATLDGTTTTFKREKQEGRSQWYLLTVAPGRHSATLAVTPGTSRWSGDARVWLLARQQQQTVTAQLSLKRPISRRPLPPCPWAAGEVKKEMLLGETRIDVQPVK